MDPELILDIFNNDAFSAISLTASVNTEPFVPGRIGEMDIFEEDGVTTTSIAIEELDGTLDLIPTAPRGAPAWQNQKQKPNLRSLTIPHLPLSDVIKASEVQNVRAFGGGGQLEAIQSLMMRRAGRMLRAHDATIEYQRVGALKGILLDADGQTVIYNLFNEFGVQQTQVDFDLGNPNADIEGKCEQVAGNVEDTLGAAVYTQMHVICGRVLWRRFISHPKVVTAFQYYQQAGRLSPLNNDLRYKGFEFGGLVFEQYRGKVGGVPFIGDSEAYAFPVGVPGLYITRFAPAEYLDTVNTVGLPRYMRQFVHPKLTGIDIDTESNPISLCTRPAVLNKLITNS